MDIWVHVHVSHFSKDLTQEVALNRDEYGIGHEEEIDNPGFNIG
jgi:hypothetical protein